MGSAVNARLIARGVLAGGVGGLAAFAFARICAEPIVGHVINLAGVRLQPASAVDDRGVESFSPSVQATGEMAFVVVSFGAAMGALLAAAFAITYVRTDSVRPGALALLLAGDAFAALSLVPSIKYRPPLGREAIISQRTGLYLLMVGLSVVLLIGVVTLGRRIARRLGTGNATFISAPVCTWPDRCGDVAVAARRRASRGVSRPTIAVPSRCVTWERSWCYGPLSLWFSRGLPTGSSMPQTHRHLELQATQSPGDSAAR